VDIGLVGLGRMGSKARRLARGGVRVIGFDPDERARRSLADTIVEARSLRDLVDALPVPRVIGLMVPAGEVTQRTVDDLAALLAAQHPIASWTVQRPSPESAARAGHAGAGPVARADGALLEPARRRLRQPVARDDAQGLRRPRRCQCRR